MKAGFIGAGKVGCTLGKYLSIHGVKVTGYYDQDTDIAGEAAQFTESIAFGSTEAAVKESDLLFLTVPDGLISSVYEEVRRFDISEKIICHCSGSISSREAFPGIEKTGAYGYSVHPLFAVSDRFDTYRELADAFFTLEGDGLSAGDAEDRGRREEDRDSEMVRAEDRGSALYRMLTDAGLKVRVIRPEDKAKYHLAAVMVSNLVLALVDSGVEKLRECGFTEDDALKAISPLAKGNMEHALDEGVVSALTGPVERGDVKTLKKHLDAIENEDERNLYMLLSRRLAEIARKKHPDRDYEELTGFLSLR